MARYTLPAPLASCACDCGNSLPSYDSRGRSKQWLRGHAPKRPRKLQPVWERFWRFVNQTPEWTDGCWEWIGSLRSTGYGQLYFKGKPAAAHRVSYILNNGPIPLGMFVCHTCDNPRCVRPDHLWLGTAADNTHDMDVKGRAVRRGPRGERSSKSKLTIAQVQLIRIRYPAESITELAREYSVSFNSIRRIITGASWGWLPGEQAFNYVKPALE